MNGDRRKKLMRRMAAGLAGAAAGIGVLLGGVFDTAEDLLPDEERREGKKAASAAVLREEAPSMAVTRISLPVELTRADRLRQWLWQLPAWVRGGVLLPCWAVGRGVIALAGLLFRTVSPVAAMAAMFLMQVLLLFLLFALLYRFLFPNARLCDLLRKGRWLWLLGGALLLTATDRILLLTLERWRWIRILIGAVTAMTVLLLLWNRLFQGHAAPKPPEKWIEIPYAA